jgi:hypothetical protein
MGGGAAAAAAAAARRRREQEEEEVTPENSDPSCATEYKILRSATGAFKRPAKLRAALEEEARAGWDLMEKLDDSRVRLRRSISWRQRDGELSQDPYRIKVGISETAFGLWIALVALGVVALIFGILAGLMALAGGK